MLGWSDGKFVLGVTGKSEVECREGYGEDVICSVLATVWVLDVFCTGHNPKNCQTANTLKTAHTVQ